jgi:hypothetical protein
VQRWIEKEQARRKGIWIRCGYDSSKLPFLQATENLLAKMGASANLPLIILEDPPSQLSSALQADAWGVAFVRE